LSDFNDTLEMRYVGAGQFSQVVPEPVDVAAIRASGLPVPLQPGAYQLTPGVGGIALLAPGSTGVSAFPGTIYEPNITLTGVPAVLAATLSFTVDTTNAEDGDTGTISGGGVAITIGANQVVFTDPTATRATLSAEMALSGLWVAQWVVVDKASQIVSFSVVPIFGTANTEYLDTPMYKNLSVTGAKIDDATIDGSTKLIDDSVDEVKLDALVRAKLNVQGRTIVPVAIPTGEMLALNTTRKLAVAAPGAGKAVVVTGVYASITYIAPIYATNINLQVISDTATAPQAESSLILVKTTNANVIIPLTTVVAAGETQIIENAAVYITTETGNATAGASNFTFYVEYMIVDL